MEQYRKRSSDFFINLNIFILTIWLIIMFTHLITILKILQKAALRNSKKLMYTSIDPRISEINNELFFELFNIEFLMIYQSELQKIDKSKFSILKTLISDNGEIIIMKRKSFQKTSFKKRKKIPRFY